MALVCTGQAPERPYSARFSAKTRLTQLIDYLDAVLVVDLLRSEAPKTITRVATPPADAHPEAVKTLLLQRRKPRPSRHEVD